MLSEDSARSVTRAPQGARRVDLAVCAIMAQPAVAVVERGPQPYRYDGTF